MTDFLINYEFPDTIQDKPHIQALPGGRFAITWEDDNLDRGYVGWGGFSGIYMKVYGSDGTELGDGDPDTLEFNRVADVARGLQFGGDMAPTAGGFVVAYESEEGDLYASDGSFDVFLQFYDANGEEIGGDVGSNNIQVTPRSNEDHRLQDVETLADGSVVVLTARSMVRTDWALEAWRYAADGTFLGRASLADEADTGIPWAFRTVPPSGELTATPDGGYVMTWWRDLDGGGHNESILARGFAADGTPLAGTSILSPPAADPDDFASVVGNDHRQPTTVARGDGTSVVYWNTDYASRPDVLLSRVVDASGAPITPVRVSAPNAELFVPHDTLELGDGWTLMSHAETVQGSYRRVDLRLFDPLGGQVGETIRGSEYDYRSIRASSLALSDDDVLGLAFQGIDTDGLDVLARVRPLGEVLAEILGAPGPVLPGDGTLEALAPPDPVPPAAPPTAPPAPGGDAGTVLRGTRKADVLTGTGGDDVLRGLKGADTLRGLGGDDRLIGHGGRDKLLGGGGEDVLMGGGGRDVLKGGGGNDVLRGGGGGDDLVGGGGRDRLLGGGGHDDLSGGGGRDRLLGGTGRDDLSGGGGRDVLRGGGGRDTLDGGRGADVLTGGRGADTFVLSRSGGRDTITDFGRGDGFEVKGVAGFGRLRFEQVGDDVQIGIGRARVIVEDAEIRDLRDQDLFDFL